MKRRKRRKRSEIVFLFYGLFCLVLFLAAIFLSLFFFPHRVVAPSYIINPNDNKNWSEGFEKELGKQGIEFDSLSYASQSSTLIVKLKNDAYVYMNTSISPSGQVKLLKTILSRMTIENPDKKVKYVDLRFEKAVVKF